MNYQSILEAVLFRHGDPPGLTQAVQRLRKDIFVDQYGWHLSHSNDLETDEFDDHNAVYAALYVDGQMNATFRAIPTDKPYLSEKIFPQLALLCAYPQRPDIWEISRFGVTALGESQNLSKLLYALMFYFAQKVGAASLVAVADLAHERLLRTLRIRTRRYGPPQIIGTDRRGGDLVAVAGEIAVAAQSADRMAALFNLLDNVEITDVSNVFGPARVSA